MDYRVWQPATSFSTFLLEVASSTVHGLHQMLGFPRYSPLGLGRTCGKYESADCDVALVYIVPLHWPVFYAIDLLLQVRRQQVSGTLSRDWSIRFSECRTPNSLELCRQYETPNSLPDPTQQATVKCQCRSCARSASHGRGEKPSDTETGDLGNIRLSNEYLLKHPSILAYPTL